MATKKTKYRPKLRIGMIATEVNPFVVYVSDDIVIGNKTYSSNDEYRFIYEHIFEIMMYFEEALNDKYDITYYFNGKEMPWEVAEQSYNDFAYNEEELGI